MQEMRLADSLARPYAGRIIEARIAMMAMTTSNSMSVNALRAFMRLETPEWPIRFNVFNPFAVLITTDKCPLKRQK